MISSNTRATRSQYSSPGPAAAAAAAQSGGPLEANKNTANDTSRAFMRRWMEPAVQQKPSFEEVGLGRYGVLESMQPLGSLPKGTSAAARKSLPGGRSNGPTRKIILRPSGAAGAGRKNSAESSEARSESSSHPRGSESRVRQGSSCSKPSPIITPSPPPSSASSPPISPSQPSTRLQPRPSHSSALPPRKSTSKTTLRDTIEKDSGLPELAPPPLELPSRRSLIMRGDLDDDYQPKAGSTMRTSATPRSPVARRSLARRSAGRQSLPDGADASRVSVAGSDDAGSDAVKKRTAVGRVVADAVESALKHHRYPTAYALRTVYDENSDDPQIVAMFEDVFLQRADAETIDQFAALISEMKQRGARDNAAYRHWDLTRVPEKPIPAPFADLIKLDLGEVSSGHGGDKRAQKKHKTTHSDSPSLPRSRRSEARTGRATDDVPSTPPPQKRARSDSLGSDSSLSSTVSFDTPNFNGTSSGLSIVAKTDGGDGRPKPTRIKIKAQPAPVPAPPQAAQASGGGKENKRERQARSIKKASGKVAKVGKGKVGTRGPSVDADAVTVSVAGGEDDVSGAPAVVSQPIARRGKPAVAQQQQQPQRKLAAATSGSSGTSSASASASTASTTSTNPARAEADGRRAPPKNKDEIRDTLSRSISPSVQTHPQQQHHNPGSHYGAGPDEIAAGRESRDMPGLVAPLFPNLPVKTSRLRSALQPEAAPNGDPEKKEEKKRRSSRGASAAVKTEDGAAPASASARPRSVARASEGRADSETPAQGRRTTRNAGRSGAVSTPPPSGVSTRSTRSAVKRARGEMEGTASPTPSVLGVRAPSEAASRASRASTPVLPPPSKKQRVGPRIKTSPKKSGNTAAGIPRLSGEGLSVHMPGAVANRDQIENDDFCSSCGGSGDLICCDCCSKSFHLECVDLDGSADLPDSWFCQDCHYKLSADKKVHRGPFGPLFNLLEKSIPRAFSLPKKVQTYFEDIKAGASGEYEEIDRTKASRKDKNQEFDFFQQRDADGNAVLCHGCQKAAGPDKLIMPCSACPLYWHLDCLETPAAHPPNPRKWVCPAHVDPFFSESGPFSRRFRRVRGAQVITPLYTRGNRNNGVIEVEDSDVEVGVEAGSDASGWKDVRTYGRVMRLPAMGIKLDFIEQLRKVGAGRISKGQLHLEDGRGARCVPSWDVAKAEAAVTLCRLRDIQPVVQRAGTASAVAVTATVDGINNGDKAEQESAEDTHATALLSQVQRGQVGPDSLSATDKQSLRQIMDSIKLALGDEPQESSVNDGIYDGASTTPEASEEAVTPKADDAADKAGADASREDDVVMGDDSAKSGMGNGDGIEVVGEGEGDDGVVGAVVPEEDVAAKAPEGEEEVKVE